MTQIDWVRATFIGATLGGFVWAAIFKLVSLKYPEIPWQARTLLIAGIVNAALLVVSWLRWRSATDERNRSLAAALWIVPFIGVAFVIAVVAMGATGELVGS
ncbi:hypothetical protein A5662_12570 [Mycobacteriaceae bacterium 1482268.1]|nr:hypothetical protein A5662_12570 [Mycobacteriaceae bacterium 1482268.1]